MFESAGTAGHYRRLMQRQLSGSQKGKLYGQRAQAETVMSMLKRNLGDALRARSPRARRTEQRLKAITHDVMLPRRQYGGSRQSRTQLVFLLARPALPAEGVLKTQLLRCARCPCLVSV